MREPPRKISKRRGRVLLGAAAGMTTVLAAFCSACGSAVPGSDCQGVDRNTPHCLALNDAGKADGG